MPNKINLLVDTDSFSHLSMIEFNKKTLFKLVFDYFNIYTCDTVFSEFGDGIRKGTPENRKTYRLLTKKERDVVLKSKNIDKIEEQLFNLKYFKSRSKKGKGERFLVSTAIEQVYLNKFSQCILLTDDQRAIDNFLDKINEDFQFGKIWTTLDLVMFLYFKVKINYDEASDVVRNLAASTSISVKRYRESNGRKYDEKEARQRLLSVNLKKLHKIKEMLKTLPGR